MISRDPDVANISTDLASGILIGPSSINSSMIIDGAIMNIDINASAAIVDTKLATISAADKVSLSALNIDGGTDIGAALADADLFVVDDGGVGTNRKAAATRIKDYVFGKISGDITINSSGSATIGLNSVALGTDTTGNYVSDVAAGTGITVTHTPAEGSSPTVSIGQAVATTSNPTFAGVTADSVQIGITAANEIDTTSGNLIIDSAGGTVTIDDNLTVSGTLTVNGSTTTVNSTTITVDDPIITLGGDTAPASDDNKDRGIEFRWHNGTVAKSGFFGYDDSTGKLTFIPDATNTSEVFSGTVGTIDVGAVHISGSQISASNLSNGVTGSGSVVLSAGPTFTGTPTLPTGTIATTQTAGNSTTAVATTAFVTTADNLKANLASPTFTGTITNTGGVIENGFGRAANGFAYIDLVSEAAGGTYLDYGTRLIRGDTGANATSQLLHRGTGDFQFNLQEAATLKFFTSSIERMRINADGTVTFTGVPSAPTAAVDTNTTQAATTAFVIGQAAAASPTSLGAVATGTSTRYARADHVHPTTGIGLTSGTLGQFAATTSAQLAGVISDETGTGSLVFGTSPTFSENITISSTGQNAFTKINAATGYYAIQYFAINGVNKWHYEIDSNGDSWALVESGVAQRVSIAKTTGDAVFSGSIKTSSYIDVGATGYTDAGSVSATGWFRSKGQTGWYSQDYGGGIYMIDTTWVRVYNNKNFYANGVIRAETSMQVAGPSADNGWEFRPWTASSDYMSVATLNMTGSEYSLLTNGTNTFISGGVGGSSYIRAGNNDTSGQVQVSPSAVYITGNAYISSATVNDSTDYVSRNSADGRIHVKSSNRDLKENIIPVSGALDTIEKLSPKTFNWKLTEEEVDSEYKILTKQTYKSMGFILEEVLEVSPELITWRTNPEDKSIYPGYWKIDDFIALSIQGVKELNEKVSELESEILILKGQK